MSRQAAVIGGTGILAIAALVLGYYLYTKAKGAAGAVVDAVSTLDNNIAGALVPDANVGVQTQEQKIIAALKAANPPNPPVGSPAYNQIVGQFDPNLVVYNSLSGSSADGG